MTVEAFYLSYVETALWSSIDDTGAPMDRDGRGIADIAASTLAEMRSDCEAFYAAHEHLWREDISDALAGHDFWLTRNRHGAGFWDGDYPEPAATILTDAAHVYGEIDLYVGDDGRVWA